MFLLRKGVISYASPVDLSNFSNCTAIESHRSQYELNLSCSTFNLLFSGRSRSDGVHWPSRRPGALLPLAPLPTGRPLLGSPRAVPHRGVYVHAHPRHQRHRHRHVGHDEPRGPLPHILTAGVPRGLLAGSGRTLPGRLVPVSPLLQQRRRILPVLHDAGRRRRRALAAPHLTALHQRLHRLRPPAPLSAQSERRRGGGRRKPQQFADQHVGRSRLEAVLTFEQVDGQSTWPIGRGQLNEAASDWSNWLERLFHNTAWDSLAFFKVDSLYYYYYYY